MNRLPVMLLMAALLAGGAPASAQFVRVSVSSTGAEIPAAPLTQWDTSAQAFPSRDGRVVVFATDAPGLVPDDTNGRADVFVRDLAQGTTTRVSVGPGGLQADNYSLAPVISANGQVVAFASPASNLVAGKGNACPTSPSGLCDDVYVHDRTTGVTTRVSVGPGGVEANASSYLPALSADGRLVAFVSFASNLVPGDTNGAPDVFVHDRQAGVTTRVSVATGGVQATHDARTSPSLSRPSLSADGRFVAFASGATNLVAGDTNTACLVDLIGLVNCPDVFVHDRLTSTTTRVSVGAGGTQADRGGSDPAMTPDGRFVAFVSSSGNLGAGDPRVSPFFVPSLTAIVYVHDRQTGETTPAWTAASQGANALYHTTAVTPSADGRFVVFGSSAPNLVPGDTNGTGDAFLWDRSTGAIERISVTSSGQELADGAGAPALAEDGRALTFISRSAQLVPADTNAQADVFLVDPGDVDGDGLPMAWERAFGLDPFGAEGDQGAAGDPDADGRTNAEELAAQTHPRNLASATRYFAEGATSAFFVTRLAVANPGSDPARVALRFSLPDGSLRSTTLQVPAGQSRKIALSQVPGLATAEFSTVLETDRPVVAERQMWWSPTTAYGTHSERAIGAPALTWYLAEGATHSGFDLFYLLQNPNAAESLVRVRYLRPSGAPLEKTYTLPPASRTNIWVDFETFDGQTPLASTDVSATFDVLNAQPIIVERAMYLTRAPQAAGGVFEAGHESAGVTAGATEWFLAEGATGEFFDLFVLVANPGADAAEITATYLLPDGSNLSKRYTVAPNSRFNIWVDLEDPRLADTAVSTTIRSTNGVPVIVERAMWWPGPTSATWTEAHNSPGGTENGTRWGIADGVVQDGPAAADTYILIANVSATPARVRVTLLYDDGGATEAREFDVGARSRFNVDVRAEFPAALGRGFGAVVESLSGESLVVERAIYNDAFGVRWAAGNNALGTKLQ